MTNLNQQLSLSAALDRVLEASRRNDQRAVSHYRAIADRAAEQIHQSKAA